MSSSQAWSHYSGKKQDLALETKEYIRYQNCVSMFQGDAPTLARNTWHLRKEVSSKLTLAGVPAGFWTHMKLHKHINVLPLDDPVNELLPELVLKVDTKWRYLDPFQRLNDEMEFFHVNNVSFMLIFSRLLRSFIFASCLIFSRLFCLLAFSAMYCLLKKNKYKIKC